MTASRPTIGTMVVRGRPTGPVMGSPTQHGPLSPTPGRPFPDRPRYATSAPDAGAEDQIDGKAEKTDELRQYDRLDYSSVLIIRASRELPRLHLLGTGR